jgi:hypothetical protein
MLSRVGEVQWMLAKLVAEPCSANCKQYIHWCVTQLPSISRFASPHPHPHTHTHTHTHTQMHEWTIVLGSLWWPHCNQIQFPLHYRFWSVYWIPHLTRCMTDQAVNQRSFHDDLVVTQRRDQVKNALGSYSGCPVFEYPPEDQVHWLRRFRGFFSPSISLNYVMTASSQFITNLSSDL